MLSFNFKINLFTSLLIKNQQNIQFTKQFQFTIKKYSESLNAQTHQMNILPKKYSQFKDKNYWNNFFNQLKNTQQENFQWYGAYHDFKQQLKKIFKHLHHKNYQNYKPQQNKHLSIFHIGCGKSTFGQDIQLQYPTYNVINTDYSEQIVKDMIKRSLMFKTMCKYEVCDMFQPLPQKYIQKFNIVLDKGTLDAILPQDIEEEKIKIKKFFFNNVETAFNKKQTCSYIIVSMLQPFLLSTILQHFYKKLQYQVQIQQSKIKDSKMQPFLVYIKRYSDSQVKFVQKITVKLLKGNKQISFNNISDTLKQIQQMQQTIASKQKVKNLSPHQHLIYSISNSQQLQKMRYTIQIIDNQQIKLQQNTCAVFIVPQGKQNSYLFTNTKGLKRLINQIGTSRLIVVKLLSGNTFKSIEQVKNQINPLIPNFIQLNSPINQVPFMTDAEQLGVRKYVYEDQIICLQQILAGQQEAFRRVIFKNNLSLVQTQYKLVYGKAQENPLAKQAQKKTKILPSKKGKFVAIDKQYIDQGYCRQIITGFLKFMIKKDSQRSNILVLGGGGYCIPKFLYQNLVIQPKIVTLQKQKSLCSQQIYQLFEIQQYVKEPNFLIINQDAYTFIINKQNEQQYDAIIVDVNSNQLVQLPPKQFITTQFIQKCYSHINKKQGGVLIYNIIRKGFKKSQLQQILKLELFDLIYVAIQWEQQQNNLQTEDNRIEQDCLVLFMVNLPENKRKIACENKQIIIQISEELYDYTHVKQKGQKSNKKKDSNNLQHKLKNNYPFIKEIVKQIKMIYPKNNTNISFK